MDLLLLLSSLVNSCWNFSGKYTPRSPIFSGKRTFKARGCFSASGYPFSTTLPKGIASSRLVCRQKSSGRQHRKRRVSGDKLLWTQGRCWSCSSVPLQGNLFYFKRSSLLLITLVETYFILLKFAVIRISKLKIVPFLLSKLLARSSLFSRILQPNNVEICRPKQILTVSVELNVKYTKTGSPLCSRRRSCYFYL